MAITLHPMLVSKNVSRVAVPVIAKALEKYILLYRNNEVIERINKEASVRARGKYKIKGKEIVRKVREQIEALSEMSDEDFDKYWKEVGEEKYGKEYQKERAKNASVVQRDYGIWKSEGGTESKIEDYEEEAKRAASASVRIEPYDNLQGLSMEPTVMRVTAEVDGVTRTEFIGVKVVPALVKSEEKLSRILLYDRQSTGIHRMAIKVGRWFINKLYRLWDKTVDIMTLGLKKGAQSGTVTGDAVKDILHNRTIFSADPKQKSGIFVCLSTNDVDDDFFQSAGGINKLFKMGWTSIVLADDVNRVAYFCTEEYKGSCVPVSYAVLYNTYSNIKVYDSLVDAKNTTGALFKTKFSISKVRSNILADTKLKKYRGR